MKPVLAILSLLLLPCLGFAASPEQEWQFLKDVWVAYTTTNIDAIMELHCWDGIEPSMKSSYRQLFKLQLSEETKVQSVRYGTSSHLPVQDDRGYVPNLKPIKYIQVEFHQRPKHRETREGIPIYDHSILELAVGEKNGKLMLINQIRAPKPEKQKNDA